MRTVLAVLVLAAALALNAVVASAGQKIDIRPVFFGDGFDNTTCADAVPSAQACK
jgi:hypothetical protein